MYLLSDMIGADAFVLSDPLTELLGDLVFGFLGNSTMRRMRDAVVPEHEVQVAHTQCEICTKVIIVTVNDVPFGD